MWFQADDFNFFWHSRWFQPLRSACPTLSEQARTMAQKGWEVPRWLRPICVQRWIGKAIARRAAWLAQQSTPVPYHFADSEPGWSKTAAMPYEARRLRQLKDADLRWFFEVKLEQLLRIALTDQAEIGQDRWTQAALGVSGHLAQAYREFKRRLGTRRARSLVRETLWLFVMLGREQTGEASAPLPVAAPLPLGALPVALVK